MVGTQITMDEVEDCIHLHKFTFILVSDKPPRLALKSIKLVRRSFKLAQLLYKVIKRDKGQRNIFPNSSLSTQDY